LEVEDDPLAVGVLPSVVLVVVQPAAALEAGQHAVALAVVALGDPLAVVLHAALLVGFAVVQVVQESVRALLAQEPTDLADLEPLPARSPEADRRLHREVARLAEVVTAITADTTTTMALSFTRMEVGEVTGSTQLGITGPLFIRPSTTVRPLW